MSTGTKVTTGATAITHDKYELPPLPDLPAYSPEVFDREVKVVSETMAEQLMHDYARAAIEADRKRTAELLKNPVHVHSNMCRGIIAPITFDMLAHVLGEKATNEWLRKRRGEPVGYIMPTAIKQLKAGGNAIVGGLPQGGDVAVYLAPQPAELTPAQIRRARLRADPVKAAALDRAKERIAAELASSADSVKGPSDNAIMFEWSQTPNTGDMRVDLIAFARALLARYK